MERFPNGKNHAQFDQAVPDINRWVKCTIIIILFVWVLTIIVWAYKDHESSIKINTLQSTLHAN